MDTSSPYKNYYSTLQNSILRFLFPTSCCICRKLADRKDYLCKACRKTFSFLPTVNTCKTCFAPVPPGADLCGKCLMHKPAYKQLVVCASYSGELRETMHYFKFRGRSDLGVGFGQMLCARLTALGVTDFDAVVPIPISHSRMIERGYNQAECIAKEVSSLFRVPLAKDALRKEEGVLRQSTLRRGMRDKNIRGAFSLDNTASICNKRILLVDDIVTSGATLREASRILSAASNHIIACAIAKTE